MRDVRRDWVLVIGSFVASLAGAGEARANGFYWHDNSWAPTAYVVETVPTSYVVPTAYVVPTSYVVPTAYVVPTSYVLSPSYSYVSRRAFPLKRVCRHELRGHPDHRAERPGSPRRSTRQDSLLSDGLRHGDRRCECL